MPTSETQTPTVNTDMPKSRAEWIWFFVRFFPALIVMSMALWIMYTWVQDDRTSQNERIDKLEKRVDDCAASKKESMEEKIDSVEEKMNEVLRRIPEKK